MVWAFLTRASSEADLKEELGPGSGARRIAEGLVVANERPKRPEGGFSDLAFARQAMRTTGDKTTLVRDTLAEQIAQAIETNRSKKEKAWSWAFQVVAPDSRNPHDERRIQARTLTETLPILLEERLAPGVWKTHRSYSDEADRLVQVWVVDPGHALIGVTTAAHVISHHPGGKLRLRRAEDAPSRSGSKLEEAIEWIGVGPGKGEVCVDLGAAPGAWSQIAVRRGAKVIGIDPAKMKVDLPHKRFVHLQQSAFEYAPTETLDWMLVDMAWRPLEVAKLIAKWGRRAWARQLLVNFKLPMKKKAKILKEAITIIEDAGWKGIRMRQLYHDRDEATVFAWLDPNIVRKGPKAPFEMRSKGKGKKPPRKKEPRQKSTTRESGRSSGRKPRKSRSKRGRKPRSR